MREILTPVHRVLADGPEQEIIPHRSLRDYKLQVSSKLSCFPFVSREGVEFCKPSRPGTTVCEWFPISLALPGQVGDPLERGLA